MPAEVHLSPTDLASRLRISIQTIYQWNSHGTGPPYLTIGRHVRYRLADVIAWENNRYAPHSGKAAAPAGR